MVIAIRQFESASGQGKEIKDKKTAVTQRMWGDKVKKLVDVHGRRVDWYTYTPGDESNLSFLRKEVRYILFNASIEGKLMI